MSSKAKFKDSYEMRLVNEFKLSLLCFAFSHEAVLVPIFVARGVGMLLHKKGRCFF